MSFELYQDLKRAADAGHSAASSVPSFHLFKALREEELLAIHSLVRVFAMHNESSTSLTQRTQQRILEDLCESFNISLATLDGVRSMAAADPSVQAVAKLGDVARLRKDHHDAFNDVDVGEWLQRTAQSAAEDDGQTIVIGTAAASKQQQNSSKRGVAKPLRDGKEKLFAEAEKLAKIFVTIPEGPDREARRQELLDMRSKVQAAITEQQ